MGAGFDGCIQIWDATTGQHLRELQGLTEENFTNRVHSVAFSQDGTRVVSGSDDEWIRIWDAETGRQIGKAHEPHAHYVFSVACSPDGKRVVSGARDGEIMIWERCCPRALRQTLGVTNLPSEIIDEIVDYHGEDLELKVKIH